MERTKETLRRLRMPTRYLDDTHGPVAIRPLLLAERRRRRRAEELILSSCQLVEQHA